MTLELAKRIKGSVYQPGDSDYAPEIAAFNTAVIHKPDVVVAASSTSDVVEAVRYAHQNAYTVTVQSTGHGAHTPITSGLLISTKHMKQVSIDPTTHIATIGAGASWDQVIPAAAKHGLAPITGSALTVGVVGYLLGGGLGPLSRSHGYSSDYLTGLTVVTGTGEVVEASAQENPDLFWALRGGKFGLGIVTEVRLRLVELKTLYGGSLFFEEQRIETALRAWVDWTATADPLVTTSVAILNFPPLEFLPEMLRGRRLLNIRFAYPGAAAEGERLAAPLRAFAPTYLDSIKEIPVTDIAKIHGDPDKPAPSWVAGGLLSHIDQDFATALLKEFGTGTKSPFLAVEIRHLGAATHRDVEGGSATGGRPAEFTIGFVGANPEQFAVMPATYDRLMSEFARWLSPETNVNFMGEPRSAEHYASAWPSATFARLNDIRRKYDPQGIFA